MFKANHVARLLSAALLGFGPLPVLALADEPAAETPAVESAAESAPESLGLSTEEIAQLIKNLDANRFSERQAATQKLGEAGKQVIPALTEAAGAGSREVTTRSIEILTRFLKSADAATSEAAQEALQKLSTSENASAASRAQESLKPKDEAIPPNPFGGGRIIIGGGGGGIQINGGGRIQFRVQAVAGPGQKVQIRNVNGVKDIQVEEGNRKIHIQDDPNKGIEIEVTEKKDDKDAKPVVTKYAAKNADELKKNHPEGHKIYEKYSNGGFGGQIQLQGIQIQGGNLPQALPQRVLPVPQLQPANRARILPAPAERPAGEAQPVPEAQPAQPAQPAEARARAVLQPRIAQPALARARVQLPAAQPEEIARRVAEIARQVEKAAEANQESDELKAALEQLRELQKLLQQPQPRPAAEAQPAVPAIEAVPLRQKLQQKLEVAPLRRALEQRIEVREALPVERE